MEHLKADREDNHDSFTESATQELRQSSIKLNLKKKKAMDTVTEDLINGFDKWTQGSEVPTKLTKCKGCSK